MGKLIIAIEIPEPSNENFSFVSTWNKDVCEDVLQSQMDKIKRGDIVSFDSAFLTLDREDDSFVEAEFRAWEPDEKKKAEMTDKEREHIEEIKSTIPSG